MNLDLLIKLVKLANNNPNENEANLAARKVCKMIEENKYSFNNTKVSEPTKRPVGSQGFDPWDIINDIIKEQKKRSDDSKKYYTDGYSDPFRAPWEESRKPPSHTIPCNKCKHPFTVATTINPKDYVCYFCKNMK